MTNYVIYDTIKMPSKRGNIFKEIYIGNNNNQIQVQNLLKIKKIIDKDKNGDKFIIGKY